MAPTPRIQARFSIPRRGGTQLWSTSYHLDNDVPDLTTFEDLIDWLEGSGTYNQTSCFYPDVELVGWDYYPPGIDVATFTRPSSLPGTLTPGAAELQSSDSVSLARWSTTAKTSKNHPIYLFNYLHGVRWKNTMAADTVDSDQAIAQQGFLQQLVDGITVNGHTFKRAGPQGAVAQSVVIDPYIRHRDFPT